MQPAGDWELSIENGTGLVAELKDFTVLTRGRMFGPQPGDRADRVEEIIFPTEAAGRVLHGTTGGYSDKEALSCAGITTAGAPDHYYEFTLSEAKRVDLQVSAAFDAVLELRSGKCADGGAAVDCDDNGWAGKNPALLDQDLGAGTYCVIVDGVYDDSGAPILIHTGEYDLFVTLE